MASEDVIELGSSDEEPDPVPKKNKPRLNAMVHIPKLSGVTIKPAKLNNPKKTKDIGGAVTISKASGSKTPSVILSSGSKNNGRLPKVFPKSGQSLIGTKPIKVINPFTKINVNPLHVKGNIPVTKLPSNITLKKAGPNKNTGPIKVISPYKTAVTTNKIGTVQNKGPNKNKPAQILPQVIPNFAQMIPTLNKFMTQNQLPTNPRIQKLTKKATVAAQNEKPIKPNVSWYRKPEDNLEEQNNKEPESSDYVEITIEDSPVKPIQNKRTDEIGTELAITIDDSPVKIVTHKEKYTTSSDNEDLTSENEKPHSKKKLNYPVDNNTIEIEIDPIEIDSPNEFNCSVKQIKSKRKKESNSENEDSTKISKKSKTGSESEKSTESLVINDDSCRTEDQSQSRKSTKRKLSPENKNKCDEDIKNKEDSFSKKQKVSKVSSEEEVMVVEDKEEEDTNKIKRINPVMVSNPSKTQAAFKEIEISDDNSAETSEFNPVYQRFIKLCFKLENSDDMKKIVEKKIKAYYRQVPKEYTESEEFVDMISSKIEAMKAGPEKMYLYIKDVVDELNMQRKAAKSQNTEIIKAREEEKKFLYGEESEFDSKRQRQIRKLEKTLKKLHRAIQKLEEQEVDFDDEEDSVYLLTESEEEGSSSVRDDRPKQRNSLLKRYKERMMRVHSKFCQLTNTKMPSEPRIHVESRPGQPTGPAKRLEKWINRKVPIGTPLPFPDFHDVLRCVREANSEDKLGWNEADIMEEARDLFTRCGKKLQRRRQENEWRLAASRISAEIGDPAEKNDELKKQLDSNKQVSAKRETEVLNKYADRQSQLKLEAEEIDDKEAEKSPLESDDEPAEVEETSPLRDKEKRKERLRRLLHKKSRKAESIEQENSNEKQIEILSEDGTEPTNTQNKEDDLKSREDRKVASPKLSDKKEASKDINGISDEDSGKVESDIDELHLLQKLHSGNEINSSGDSDTPIAISDTLTSSGENENNKVSSDVISIENSSYSESESARETNKSLGTTITLQEKENEEKGDGDKVESIPLCHITADKDRVESIESDHTEEIIKSQKENIEELQIAESCLLESSDEEKQTKNSEKKSKDTGSEYVNLKDDNISIGETVIIETVNKTGDVAEPHEKNTESLHSVDSTNEQVPRENCVSLSEEDSNKEEETLSVKENCISLSEEDSNKGEDEQNKISGNLACDQHDLEANINERVAPDQKVLDSNSVESIPITNDIEIQSQAADSSDATKTSNDGQSLQVAIEVDTEESVDDKIGTVEVNPDECNASNILEKSGGTEDLENLLKDLSDVCGTKDIINKDTRNQDAFDSNPESQESANQETFENKTDKEICPEIYDSNSQVSIQEISDSGDDSQNDVVHEICDSNPASQDNVVKGVDDQSYDSKDSNIQQIDDHGEQSSQNFSEPCNSNPESEDNFSNKLYLEVEDNNREKEIVDNIANIQENVLEQSNTGSQDNVVPDNVENIKELQEICESSPNSQDKVEKDNDCHPQLQESEIQENTDVFQNPGNNSEGQVMDLKEASPQLD